MADIVSGHRVGPFIVICDTEGLRHSIRTNSVLAISDADDQQVTTRLLLYGGQKILILLPFDEVLLWFS